jgi:hypothetical protein
VNATIVPARLEHAFVLAQYMRPKDVAELEAAGLTPLEAVLQSLRVSEHAWAVLYDDVVGAMLGIQHLDEGPRLGRRDLLWFLTAHLFAEKPMAFFRLAKQAVAAMLERYPRLVNVIDARHDDALRFSAALGATFGAPVPFGPKGMPFIPFEIRRR